MKGVVKKISTGNSIGKMFLTGYLVGKAIEVLGTKKTKYSNFLSARFAIAGACIYVCSKILPTRKQ